MELIEVSRGGVENCTVDILIPRRQKWRTVLDGSAQNERRKTAKEQSPAARVVAAAADHTGQTQHWASAAPAAPSAAIDVMTADLLKTCCAPSRTPNGRLDKCACSHCWLLNGSVLLYCLINRLTAVQCAVPRKFRRNPSTTSRVILLRDKQTHSQ